MNKHNVKSKPLLIAIVGPTASGKTDLALKLAKKFKGLVISADSRQIYKHASIGTNQPIGEYRIGNRELRKLFGSGKLYFVKNVPYFFIDTLPPTKAYSVAKFQKEVYKLLNSQFSIHNSQFLLPILVGGTGLYVSAITESYRFPEVKTNPKLRQILERQTTTNLLTKLKKSDITTYKSIDRKNRRRIIRALEYALSSGQSFLASQHKQPRPNTLTLGLRQPKDKLRTAIAKRTKQMIKAGLLKETRYLMRHYPASILLKTIGYQEVLPVLKRQRTLAEARELINTHTWQYARRQMTWFKSKPNINWVNSLTQASKLISKFLKQESP